MEEGVTELKGGHCDKKEGRKEAVRKFFNKQGNKRRHWWDQKPCCFQLRFEK
jgi:hypothetical protein